MNIYDKLNDLTDAIKSSDEFKRYKSAAAAVDADPTHSAMLKDFMSVQMELSTAKMLGRQPDEEQIARFNNVYTSIANISDISEFLQAQMQFSRIMEDVSKEIAKAADVEADFMNIMPDIFGKKD